MKLKRRRIKRGRIEIIPMIDTIVILLIFYMSFSSFAEVTRVARIDLPESHTGDEFRALPNQVILNMISAEEIILGGRVLSVEELPDLLRAMKHQDPPKDAVILRGDRSMSYRDLSELMKACAEAGIVDVAFTTFEAR
jgi:biopolymer transport protein ExbD